ncbi:MAG: hypothetical protein LBU04_07095 [Christensenellaceae bacterium]|jgi:hypothetical protein|nr:hypothetical protein [Christensenellaceae bacterium]
MFEKLLIGTKYYQDYIECNLAGDTQQREQFSQTNQLLSGTTLSIRSGFDTSKRTLSWFPQNRNTFEKMDAIRNGKWGTGYIYFADMNATNLLPHYFSMPYLRSERKIGFDKFSTAQTIPTPANDIELPILSAKVFIPHNGWVNKFTFLVPDDCDLAVGIKGEPNDKINFILEWGAEKIELDISDNLNTVFDYLLTRSNYQNTNRLASFYINDKNGIDDEQDAYLYGLQITRVPTLSTIDSVNRLCPTFSVGRGISGATIQDMTIDEKLNSIGTNWEYEMSSVILSEEELRRQ